MANYLAVIHQGPDGGFWAEVPALPGCYTQGETMEELTANLRDAIRGVLAVLEEDGRVPEASTGLAESEYAT